jgi:hypothetical protein
MPGRDIIFENESPRRSGEGVENHPVRNGGSFHKHEPRDASHPIFF